MLPIPLSVTLSVGIRWSPDSRQLTYVNRGKDGDNIWSFRSDDGALHQLTHFRGVAIIGFEWSPDGKELVFSRGVQTREVSWSRTQDQNRLLFVPTQRREAVRFPRVWMTIERAQGKPPPCPPDSS